MEEVKEILLEGEDDDFDSIPINLEAIKKIMSECKDESAAVVEKFESVYGALNELQENSVRRSGEADDTLTDLEKNEKANEIENEKILAEIERLDKEESSLHDDIAKTDQNMQKARDDVFRQQKVIKHNIASCCFVGKGQVKTTLRREFFSSKIVQQQTAIF